MKIAGNVHLTKQLLFYTLCCNFFFILRLCSGQLWEVVEFDEDVEEEVILDRPYDDNTAPGAAFKTSLMDMNPPMVKINN